MTRSGLIKKKYIQLNQPLQSGKPTWSHRRKSALVPHLLYPVLPILVV